MREIPRLQSIANFLIWFILICIIISLIIFLFVGEDGYKHICKHADTCPGSVRCANERKMKCYEPKDR